MFNKRNYAAAVMEDLFLFCPFIRQAYPESPVEKCQLPQSLGENIPAEIQDLEYLRVGLKRDLRTPSSRLPNYGQRPRRNTPLIMLLIHASVLFDLHIEPLRKGIYDRYSDSVQPARYPVRL
jgi:hypothetical protein